MYMSIIKYENNDTADIMYKDEMIYYFKKFRHFVESFPLHIFDIMCTVKLCVAEFAAAAIVYIN